MLGHFVENLTADNLIFCVARKSPPEFLNLAPPHNMQSAAGGGGCGAGAVGGAGCLAVHRRAAGGRLRVFLPSSSLATLASRLCSTSVVCSMMLRCLALASVAALGRAAGAPPKGSTIAASSNVVRAQPVSVCFALSAS